MDAETTFHSFDLSKTIKHARHLYLCMYNFTKHSDTTVHLTKRKVEDILKATETQQQHIIIIR